MLSWGGGGNFIWSSDVGAPSKRARRTKLQAASKQHFVESPGKSILRRNHHQSKYVAEIQVVHFTLKEGEPLLD